MTKLMNELKHWRDRRSLTQFQAAQILGVRLRTYQNWEVGRQPAYPDAVLALLKEKAREPPKSARQRKRPKTK